MCIRDRYNPYDGVKIRQMAQEKDTDMPDFTGKKLMVSMGRNDDCKEFWHLIKALFLIRDAIPEAALCIICLLYTSRCV